MNWKVRIPDCIKNYKGEYKLRVTVEFDKNNTRSLLVESFYEDGVFYRASTYLNIDDKDFVKKVEDFIKSLDKPDTDIKY